MGNDLTADQRTAAVIDAQGHDRSTIAGLVGVSASAIARWRGQDSYTAEVARLRERGLAKLDSTLQSAREKLAKAQEKAIDTLTDNLTAEDEDGDPLYKVRNQAAAAILTAGKALIVPEDSAAAGGGAAAAAVIQFTLPAGAADPRKFDAEGTAEPAGR